MLVLCNLEVSVELRLVRLLGLLDKVLLAVLDGESGSISHSDGWVIGGEVSEDWGAFSVSALVHLWGCQRENQRSREESKDKNLTHCGKSRGSGREGRREGTRTELKVNPERRKRGGGEKEERYLRETWSPKIFFPSSSVVAQSLGHPGPKPQGKPPRKWGQRHVPTFPKWQSLENRTVGRTAPPSSRFTRIRCYSLRAPNTPNSMRGPINNAFNSQFDSSNYLSAAQRKIK